MASLTSFPYPPVRTILALLALMLLLPATAQSQGLEDKIEKDQRIEIRPGMVPPDFTAADLDGQTFSLSEMAGEMPVIIDFWATWCPPCRAEIPHLNEFARMYDGEVLVVGVTSEVPRQDDELTLEDVEQRVRDFREEQELVYRIIHSPSGEISKSYGVTGIPYLIVIGVDGIVITTHLGYSEETDIIAELEEDLGL